MNPKNSFGTPEIEINNVEYCELTKVGIENRQNSVHRNVKN
jgi:hypothetical protein